MGFNLMYAHYAKRPSQSRGPFFLLNAHNQVQVIRPFAEELQVFAVSVWVAVATQLAGGPATAVNVTDTFCDGVKPCAVPLPEKYAPALSAA
jgi:hypothetical protein